MANRLQRAHSPYLLQHKDNPVDWYAWGDAAFEKARAEDKPIFLSIGYSTCHWCHVMAHESFEDEEVARLMNDAFVNIKVDREERPDIDSIYMTVCQMMTGSGGWPLTILMTPDKKPFYAATYIPRESRHGRMGMKDLIPRIQQAWEEHRGEVLESAENVTGHLQQAASHASSGASLDEDWLQIAYEQLRKRFDPKHGGFGNAPKFPSPHNLLFLLRYERRTGKEHALRMVETTLDKMRLGGVYDHVGYGFHRYSTDAQWKLPHFEKMLYDQAMLAMAYTEAFQATDTAAYEQTTREIFTYVLRDMTAPEGGFYSAEDADSEGREGTFYVWSTDEIREVLDEELANLVIRAYNLTPEGNFEEEATRQKTGENILFLKKPIGDLAEDLGVEIDDLASQLETARQRLFDHREQRVHPGKDDKILADWNGLMIAALAKAAQAFSEPAYADAAQQAADFVLETMRTDEGRLLHRYRDGDAAIPGNLDDYAFVIWGLLDLYEATFEVCYLQAALELNDHLIDHFWDEEHGAFFFAPDDGEQLIVRQKEGYDAATPSGNSVAMLDLIRLGRLTGDPELEQKADAIGAFFAGQIKQQASGFTAMLMALDFAVGPSYEVVIAGDPEAGDTQAMIEALRSRYVPNKVVLLRPARDDEAASMTQLAPFTSEQRPLDGQATAYVCQDFQCNQPTTDVEEMVSALSAREM